MPQCPEHLDDVARAEWQRITELLASMKLLTTADRAGLAIYCQAWGRMVEAEKKLREEGMVVLTEKGYPVISPYVSIVNGAMKQLRGILAEFGLTPASRSRVHVPDKPDEDPIDAYLRQRQS